MSHKTRQQLIDLGAEILADALLELASSDDRADDLLERLISTPQENTKRFRTKLTGLKRSEQFVPWRESAGFARELEDLLQDLSSGVESDPCMGAELVADFYETDEGTLGHCDDSSGNIGDVYRFDAKDLFVDYASHCSDKDRLLDLVLELNRADNYGVRDTLIDCAAEYLPESSLRIMISRLQGWLDKDACSITDVICISE